VGSTSKAPTCSLFFDQAIKKRMKRVIAFLRSSFKLGILGKERFEYWHLLIWTLIRKARQLPLAVTLAIYGHHFRRICDIHSLSRAAGVVGRM
jgi:hypothetical protein